MEKLRRLLLKVFPVLMKQFWFYHCIIQVENHQSNCCEKMHELLEADIRRRVLTIHRVTSTLTRNHSSSPIKNVESDPEKIIRKSKGCRRPYKCDKSNLNICCRSSPSLWISAGGECGAREVCQAGDGGGLGPDKPRGGELHQEPVYRTRKKWDE